MPLATALRALTDTAGHGAQAAPAELTGSSAPLGDTVEGKSLLGPEHKSVADASETRTTSTVAVFASRSGMSVGAPFSHAGETDEPYSGALQPAAQNPDMRHPTHEAVDSGVRLNADVEHPSPSDPAAVKHA